MGKHQQETEMALQGAPGAWLFLMIIYFFLIRANEVELQERCKSLIGE